MNTTAASRIVGVCPATLRDWALAGIVPCRVVERRRKRIYLFDEATLRAWVTGRDAQPPKVGPDWSAVA